MLVDVFYGGPGTEDPEAVRWIASPLELLAASDFPIEAGPIKTSLHTLAKAGWVLRMRQRTPKHVMKTRPKVSISPPGKEDFGFRWKLRARPYFKERWEVLRAIQREPNIEKFSMTHFEVKCVDVPVHDEALRKELAEARTTIKRLAMDKDTLNVLNHNQSMTIEEQAKTIVALKKERDALLFGRDALVVKAGKTVYGPFSTTTTDKFSAGTSVMHSKPAGGSETMVEHLQNEVDRLSKLLEIVRPPESLEAILAEYREDPFPLLREWTERKIAGLVFTKPAPPHDPVTYDNVIDLAEHLQQRASVEMDTTLEERLSRAIGE